MRSEDASVARSRGAWLEDVGWVAALAAVTAALLAVRPRVGSAHVALTYLLVVLGASARRGRRLGMALAAACFVAFNVFFVPPYGTLVVRDPLDLVVLAAFLVTSAVAAQLLHLGRAARHADALREADRVKDALLAAVSHDLRTPLTTIKALAHEIAGEGDERAAEIESQADRLNRYVGDLLDLSRIDAGAVPVRTELVPIDDLLGAVLQQVAAVTDGREVRVTLPPDWPMLVGRCDFALATRVLANLVENAVRHAREGAVDVTAAHEGAWIRLAVADRGPGVAPEDRARIFEPFQRGQSTHGSAGTGLGLAIARRLAEAQGGAIELADRPGGGAVFTLVLPAGDVVDADGAPPGAREES